MSKPRFAVPGLVMSLASLATCCAPIGLVGAVLGFLSLRSARELGLAKPLSGILAIVLGLASMVELGVVVHLYKRDQAAKNGQAAQALARAESGRHAGTLDKETACALAEAYLVKHHATMAEKVQCEGALTADGAQASLAQVKLKKVPYTVCFQRAQGEWFAGAALTWGPCPQKMIEPTFAAGATAEAKGEAVRKAFTAALVDSQAKAFAMRVVDLVQRVDAGAAPLPRSCPRIEAPSMPVIDAQVVKNGQLVLPEKGWEFLSSALVAEGISALSARTREAETFTEAGRALQGYTLVLLTDDRRLPSRSDDDKAYLGGYFDGRMVVVDGAKNELICAPELRFESSRRIESAKIGLKLGPKVTVGGDLQDDFRKNFSEAVSVSLRNAMSGALTAGEGPL